MLSTHSARQGASYHQERRDQAVRAAAGRWREIFISIGIDRGLVDGRARPCPVCGGRDRFVFDDKRGRGNYFCRGCGAGDGFSLISKYLQCGYPEALRTVERFCGLTPPARGSAAIDEEDAREQTPAERVRGEMLRIWSEAHPVREGDAVWTYLKNRGLDPGRAHPEIRTHEGLVYAPGADEPGLGVRTLPAMLSRVTDAHGVVVNLHRTYLEPGGVKARVAHPRKLMPGLPCEGAVRLGGIAAGGAIGIAEGVETALAAGEMFGLPVWATIGCGNMAELSELPEGVRAVTVFADNDAKFAGQAAAYAFAHRWACRGMKVEVVLPGTAGEDWLDVWNRSKDPAAPSAECVAVRTRP